MWLSRQFPADLVTFTEEILNGKLHLIIFAKSFTLDVWQGSEYASNGSNFTPIIILQDI